MYFVGIDIAKYKHDCFITTETGHVVCSPFTITNSYDGFEELLAVLDSLSNQDEIRIGFESTGHYALNLKFRRESPLQLHGIQPCSSCEVQQVSVFKAHQDGCN